MTGPLMVAAICCLPLEEEESFNLGQHGLLVWLLAGRLVYIRNSFIPHPVKSTMGLADGLEDLPC